MLNLKMLNQLFSNMRVGYIAHNKFITLPFNMQILPILKFLITYGYIIQYRHYEELGIFKIFLKYKNQTPLLRQITCYSKPGKNNFLTHNKLQLLNRSKPTAVISTKKGLMFCYEAVLLQLSGQLLFELKL